MSVTYSQAIERVNKRKRVFADIDTTEGPKFLVIEVTKVFFKRSGGWLRWLEREDKIIGADGEKFEPVREARGEEGEARIYQIADIEEMIYAMHQSKVIDERQRIAALYTLMGVALVWGFL